MYPHLLLMMVTIQTPAHVVMYIDKKETSDFHVFETSEKCSGQWWEELFSVWCRII